MDFVDPGGAMPIFKEILSNAYPGGEILEYSMIRQ
jgi:hypothetical protein